MSPTEKGECSNQEAQIGDQNASGEEVNLVEAKITWEIGKCLGITTRSLDELIEVLTKMRKGEDTTKGGSEVKRRRGRSKKKT